MYSCLCHRLMHLVLKGWVLKGCLIQSEYYILLIANTQGLKRYALGVDEWREMMPTLRMPRRNFWGILCDNGRSCALCCVNLLPCLGIYSRVPSFPRASRRSGSGLTHGQGDNTPPHFKDNIQIKATQLISSVSLLAKVYIGSLLGSGALPFVTMEMERSEIWLLALGCQPPAAL